MVLLYEFYFGPDFLKLNHELEYQITIENPIIAKAMQNPYKVQLYNFNIKYSKVFVGTIFVSQLINSLLDLLRDGVSGARLTPLF